MKKGTRYQNRQSNNFILEKHSNKLHKRKKKVINPKHVNIETFIKNH